MRVTIKRYTPDPVAAIGEDASICYDAKTDRESNIKRASHCKDKGHLMTLRFAHATFNIAEISRVCSHQLVRVAHAGILQESQRYVAKSSIEFVNPDSLSSMTRDLQKDWSDVLALSRAVYQASLKQGMKKEDARYILPQACTTQLNICMNFQGWKDFLKNRNSKAAQWEIREVAQEIERQLQEIAPEIFGSPSFA